ncbi:MAG TPA: gamma-glutamyltransferase [Gammaproteobacteria bacterium]|nr:gamma-glutamyltransferase [Gammaproteobacteria bacterium]
MLPPERFLQTEALTAAAAAIDPLKALRLPAVQSAGDAVWSGAVDARGFAVSFIQSVFWEFASRVVLENAGIQQKRGSSFRLEDDALNGLAHHPDGLIEGAADARDDGRAAVW